MTTRYKTLGDSGGAAELRSQQTARTARKQTANKGLQKVEMSHIGG